MIDLNLNNIQKEELLHDDFTKDFAQALFNPDKSKCQCFCGKITKHTHQPTPCQKKSDLHS